MRPLSLYRVYNLVCAHLILSHDSLFCLSLSALMISYPNNGKSRLYATQAAKWGTDKSRRQKEEGILERANVGRTAVPGYISCGVATMPKVACQTDDAASFVRVR